MKQHKLTIVFFFAAVLVFLANGCLYNKGEVPVPENKNISYSRDVKPILITYCYKCHTDTATNPDRPGYAFFNHFDQLQTEALKPSPANPGYTVLIARLKYLELPGMPLDSPEPLPDSLIQKIQDWVSIGAPEN